MRHHLQPIRRAEPDMLPLVQALLFASLLPWYFLPAGPVPALAVVPSAGRDWPAAAVIAVYPALVLAASAAGWLLHRRGRGDAAVLALLTPLFCGAAAMLPLVL